MHWEEFQLHTLYALNVCSNVTNCFKGEWSVYTRLSNVGFYGLLYLTEESPRGDTIGISNWDVLVT